MIWLQPTVSGCAPIYNINSSPAIHTQVFVLIGCIGGVLGAAWIRCNVAMIRVRARHVPANRPMRRLCEVTCHQQGIICTL
jgi:H+/Cl- antiporter ClcA